MKKILWFLVGFALLAGLGKVFTNAWQTAAFFTEHGREGTLVIGAKYNASHWTSPVPIKKIHSYVAVLAPNHELVIETERELKAGEELFIRFLLRDKAEEVRALSVRPVVGSLRLKSEADGIPVRLDETDLFDRLVDRAMGPPAEGVYVRQRPVAEAGPSRDKPTVPFVFAGAKDHPVEIIWNNSGIGEWIILGAWLIAIKMILLHAWVTPFDPNRRTGAERKDFVHPSMRRIDADKPAAPSQKITYTPKPEDHDYTSDEGKAANPPPPRRTVTLPTGAADPSAPPAAPTEPYSTATTAPFVPVGGSDEVSLKLKRKPKLPDSGSGDSTPPTPPPAGDKPAA